MSSSLFTTLELIAAVLMGSITVGVIYITTSEWRDRRRREDETRKARRR
ncbi:MAG: hypothetical protein NT070_02390 [Cyanobacteria bacterium]|nr:hypothetical protein [Cyanobacteriota bacterium]